MTQTPDPFQDGTVSLYSSHVNEKNLVRLWSTDHYIYSIYIVYIIVLIEQRFPPDCGGCSEGLDAFSFFFKHNNWCIYTTYRRGVEVVLAPGATKKYVTMHMFYVVYNLYEVYTVSILVCEPVAPVVQLVTSKPFDDEA